MHFCHATRTHYDALSISHPIVSSSIVMNKVAGHPERAGYFPENRANWLSHTPGAAGIWQQRTWDQQPATLCDPQFFWQKGATAENKQEAARRADKHRCRAILVYITWINMILTLQPLKIINSRTVIYFSFILGWQVHHHLSLLVRALRFQASCNKMLLLQDATGGARTLKLIYSLVFCRSCWT